MTIDEAIKHCLEVAEDNDLAAGTYDLLAENNHNLYEKLTAESNSKRCTEFAGFNRQLAEWLTELADLKEEIEYCSGDINEMIAKAETEERKCFNDVDISYSQGYIEGLREGEKYINRIKFKKEIQAELDKILNGNIVGIEIIDGLPE